MPKKTIKLGEVVSRLKYQDLPQEDIGSVLLSAILDVKNNYPAQYNSRNFRRYMNLENRAMLRAANSAYSHDEVPEITDRQMAVLQHTGEIYTVRYIIDVPMLMVEMGENNPSELARFFGEVAYSHLAHCGSKRKNPAEPDSPYKVYLDGLRSELERKFNTKLSPIE